MYLFIKHLVLPPGVQIALGLVALVLWHRAPRLGRALAIISLASLWGLSTPMLATALVSGLERFEPVSIDAIEAAGAEAILVLGGGARRAAREFHGLDDVSSKTLERLRYGARLRRLTGLPLAVSGGTPSTVLPEGFLMATTLEADFDLPVRFVESESLNTAENARSSARRFDFRRIVLVTHAIHMPRAERAFIAAGFEVTAAPMGYMSGTRAPPTLRDFLPSIAALGKSHYALYEYLGAVWYAIHYG